MPWFYFKPFDFHPAQDEDQTLPPSSARGKGGGKELAIYLALRLLVVAVLIVLFLVVAIRLIR